MQQQQTQQARNGYFQKLEDICFELGCLEDNLKKLEADASRLRYGVRKLQESIGWHLDAFGPDPA